MQSRSLVVDCGRQLLSVGTQAGGLGGALARIHFSGRHLDINREVRNPYLELVDCD